MGASNPPLTAPAALRLMPQMLPDDEAAVARARSGDEEAFRLLVDRHGRSIYRLAFRLTGHAEDAEDVVQETFVKAFRQIDRFEARANFSTWLYRIAFNCAIDYTRTRAHRDRPDSLEALTELPAETGPNAYDLAYATEIGQRVERALDALSAQERAAFVLRHFEGCSIDEICRTLDIRTNAAKHAVFRAVRKLRAALGPVVAGRIEA